MGDLLIITGPPGAGKSTVASRMVGLRSPSALIEGDAFFGFLRQGRVEPWLRESAMQNETVTDAAGAATGHFAASGYWTAYDGVVGPWFRQRFIAATGLHQVNDVVILPSVDTCAGRVATRTGHGFSDEEATRKMHAQFDHGAAGWPQHVVQDPPADVAAVVAIVKQRLDDGQLVASADSAPQ